MKNPDWDRNELILLLNPCFSFGQMDGINPDIKKLSNLLSLSNLNLGFSRSISRVSLKLANFKRMDPVSLSKGITLSLEELKQKINRSAYGREEL